MRIAQIGAVNSALSGQLSTFSLWFAFLAWRPHAIGIFPKSFQSALEEEFDLLIHRTVLAFRELFDSRFQAGSDSDQYRNAGFIHLKSLRISLA